MIMTTGRPLQTLAVTGLIMCKWCFQDGLSEQEPATSGQPSSESAAESTEAAQQSNQRRRAANWAGKSSIIDQLNELVGELRDIDSSIAAHVRRSNTPYLMPQLTFIGLGHATPS